MRKTHRLFVGLLSKLVLLTIICSQISIMPKSGVFLIAAIIYLLLHAIWYREILRIDPGTNKQKLGSISVDFQHHSVIPLLSATPAICYIAIYLALDIKELVLLITNA